MLPTLDEIARMVSLQLGIRAVKGSDHLVEELGAESADLMNLAATLDERYQVSLDESALARVQTVADLHALVVSQL
jgi:acyl carrier protein